MSKALLKCVCCDQINMYDDWTIRDLSEVVCSYCGFPHEQERILYEDCGRI